MRVFFLMSLALSALGCAGTETGNPNAEMQLFLNARSADPASVSLRQAGGAFVVEQAWLTLDRLTFSAGTSCSSPTRLVETQRIGLGDHSGPDALELPLKAQAGAYSCATAAFNNGAEEKPLGAPDEVLNHSIVLQGRLADGTPVKIASDFSALVRLDASPEPFALATGSAVLLTFDLAAWLRGIDFSTLEADPAAGITLSATKNTQALATFEGNVAPGIELFLDVAANGAVDPEDTKAAGGSL